MGFISLHLSPTLFEEKPLAHNPEKSFISFKINHKHDRNVTVALTLTIDRVS